MVTGSRHNGYRYASLFIFPVYAPDEEKIPTRRYFTTAGLAAEIKYTFLSRYVGFGFGLIGNLNFERSYFGFTTTIQAGKMRAKKKR